MDSLDENGNRIYAKWGLIRRSDSNNTSESGAGGTDSAANSVSVVNKPDQQAAQHADQANPASDENAVRPMASAQAAKATQTGENHAPATGDDSQIALHFLWMTAGLSLLVADLAILKRRRSKRH